jgi:hypothetical protein
MWGEGGVTRTRWRASGVGAAEAVAASTAQPLAAVTERGRRCGSGLWKTQGC